MVYIIQDLSNFSLNLDGNPHDFVLSFAVVSLPTNVLEEICGTTCFPTAYIESRVGEMKGGKVPRLLTYLQLLHTSFKAVSVFTVFAILGADRRIGDFACL